MGDSRERQVRDAAISRVSKVGATAEADQRDRGFREVPAGLADRDAADRAAMDAVP